MRKHNGELEIDEDLKMERRTWTVQRVSWVILILIVIAALLGFTGRGGVKGINKLTKSTASQAMEVEYDRFLRDEVEGEMKITLHNLKSANPTLFFSKEFYDKVRVEEIVPEPEHTEISPDGITYTFRATKPEFIILFYTKPLHIGPLQITAKGPDNEAVTMSQFVYP
ncbi:hypothetical protein H7F15_08910 [Pontibacter sp. Tf4]|uniref:hypothetical protein n=1 Tax=Pontibacter sp. Tf4 TaxID=2761620 RepID=UPI0016293417|nr:hypothetical protein [Pontibacter sp. Tf4]MBB6611154.1 hypothetical protein [Pontibacter sp. Tf4]